MIRRFVHALAAVLLLAAGAAYAQYPNKPVKIIVPFPAGQATDLAARIIAEGLSKEWSQSVVVENVGGGAGIPGMVQGRGAPPDGYTLVMGTSAVMVVNPAIMEKLPYDPLNDFVLIGPVFRNPLIIVATEKSPYRNVKDLVDAAKKEPGKLNWGYPGAGTTQHLTGELFKQVAGVDIQG
jgi:tripartite-type tricarboxylate transporter receptor subunit TctC